jgi:hypothetical protein
MQMSCMKDGASMIRKIVLEIMYDPDESIPDPDMEHVVRDAAFAVPGVLSACQMDHNGMGKYECDETRRITRVAECLTCGGIGSFVSMLGGEQITCRFCEGKGYRMLDRPIDKSSRRK